MQTIYYSTTNFVQSSGNIVDLGEYRRKLALSQEGSLAPQPKAEDCFYEQAWEDVPDRALPHRSFPETARPRASARRRRRALLLDMCASLGVLVMTLTFTLRILLG